MYLLQNESKIVAYTTDGQPLTKDNYKKRIKKISEMIDEGAQTYSSEEVKKHVLDSNQ